MGCHIPCPRKANDLAEQMWTGEGTGFPPTRWGPSSALPSHVLYKSIWRPCPAPDQGLCDLEGGMGCARLNQKEGYPRAALIAWRLFALPGQPSSLPLPPRSVFGWGLRGHVLPCWGQRTLHSRSLHPLPVKSRKWMLGALN